VRGSVEISHGRTGINGRQAGLALHLAKLGTAPLDLETRICEPRMVMMMWGQQGGAHTRGLLGPNKEVTLIYVQTEHMHVTRTIHRTTLDSLSHFHHESDLVQTL
jgi:hypothetical protein